MTQGTFKLPHTLVILFSMVVLAQVMTYVIPAGSFERVESESGRMQVVPGTFRLTPEAASVSPFVVLTAIPRGFSGAHEIIFFVFFIGGLFAVLRATGSLEAGMAALLRRWGDRPFWLIAGCMSMFAFGTGTIGLSDYYLFIPVLVRLCIALGYDRLTGVAIILFGYGTGYGPAMFNPFTTLIAQDIAGLEPGSGLWYRVICFFVFVGLGIHHVWTYAKRVREDPSKSFVADVEVPDGAAIPRCQDSTALADVAPMTGVQKAIMATLAAGMMLLVYGMSVWKWELFEMQGLFAGLTLLIAVIARMSPDLTAIEFSKGAASLTSVALLIGVARAIQVVLDEGGVVDTMVHEISMPIQELPSAFSAIAMFFVQTIVNFFIPSGSGQAYVTMPIMVPLADIVGIERQVAVLAFQFGDGFSNIVVPTNYVLIAMLAMAGIPYDRWLRFILPFILKVVIVAPIALAVAVMIGYK
ncbi:MAG: TIGR00366 family protein [Woeseia sp.]